MTATQSAGGGRRLPLLFLAVLLLVAGGAFVAGPLTGVLAPRGTLVLRYAVPPDNFGGFQSLDFDLAWAGANRGYWRDENYSTIPLRLTHATISSASDRPLEVARGLLPAGHYDRVFAASPVVFGTRPDGRKVKLMSHIEPMARGFDLAAGATVTIDLELIVLPEGWQAQPTWDIFVKDARIAGSP